CFKFYKLKGAFLFIHNIPNNFNNMVIFTNGSILYKDQFKHNLQVGVENKKISFVREEKTIEEDGAEVIDLEGGHLVPGLIDVQLYGTEGNYFGGQPSVSNLRGMEDDLIDEGLCGFLATVATNTDKVVEKAIESAKA